MPAHAVPAHSGIGAGLSAEPGIDTASRVILASARTLFRAFVDEAMLSSWRAPEGMTARIMHFDPRVGGGYTMVLRYGDEMPATLGKTRAREDEVEVRFVELLPDEQIVEEVHFISTDPAFEQPMTLTARLERVSDGTKVTLRAENVPTAIASEDHRDGMRSALLKLAHLVE